MVSGRKNDWARLQWGKMVKDDLGRGRDGTGRNGKKSWAKLEWAKGGLGELGRHRINAFPNENFRHFQTESDRTLQFQFDENCRKFSKAISPFSTVFSKDVFSRDVKTRACSGKSQCTSIL